MATIDKKKISAQLDTIKKKALDIQAKLPKPTVAGASTSKTGPSSSLKSLSINLAKGSPTGVGAARGDDYAPAFNAAGGQEILKKTKGSMTQATDIIAGKQTIRGARSANKVDEAKRQAEMRVEVERIKKQKKDKIRRDKLTKGAGLATDALRASTLNTAEGESITGQSPRSNRVLSDAEVANLASRGYREGDFVPGEGKLLPNGTFDRSGLTKLDDIKAKALEIQKKLDVMKANEKSAIGGAVATDEPVVKQESDALNSVAESAKKSPISQTLALLDQEILNINNQLKGDVKQIGRDYKQSKTDLEGQQKSETGQQSVQLANAGGYLGYSGGAQGVMLNLAESHRAELSALDTKRQKAITDAKNAAAERKFDVVREKAQAVQRIEEAAYEAELKYQADVKAQKDKEAIETEALNQQSNIIKVIEGGAKTPEAIFKALGSNVSLDVIDTVLGKLSPSKKLGDSFAYSKTDVAQFLGAGLSQDDIAVLNDTVNELGYSDEVRSTLPPAVRVIADKIYRDKTGANNTVSGIVINGKNIGSATLQVLDGFTKLSKLTPTARQDVRDDLYELGFGNDTAPDWFSEEDYPDRNQPSSIGGYMIPSITGLTGEDTTYYTTNLSRNDQWRKYVRGIMSEDDTEDTEVDEVDLIRQKIQARER